VAAAFLRLDGQSRIAQENAVIESDIRDLQSAKEPLWRA
jgi:hypothetical protein